MFFDTGLIRIENVNNEGETILHKACSHGTFEIVLYLLRETGSISNLYLKNKNGHDCIILAKAYGHDEVYQYISKKLHMAALAGDIDTCEKLIMSGECDPLQTTEDGYYDDLAIHLACYV